jgi:hypothetical protein
MVERDERRALRCGGELAVEPREPLAVELTLRLAGTRAVEHDEPERARVGRVLHRRSSLTGEIEARPQRVPLVVVPRQRIGRRAEPGNLFAHERVLVRRGVVGEVAGDEDGGGTVGQLPRRLDRPLQPGDRIPPARWRRCVDR